MRVQKAVESESLAETAYQYVLNQILRGKYPLGAEINRKEISAKLGMSLLPIGEAIQRLEQELLLESGRRKGTRVRVPTPQEIRGFCVVREALETQAARQCAERANATFHATLRTLATQLDSAYEAAADRAVDATDDQMHELRLLHLNFHLRIAEGAACPYLFQQIQKNQRLVFNCFYDKLFGLRRLPENWHLSLAEKIARGNAGEADAAMRFHVRHHLDEILYKLEPFLSLDPERLLSK